MQTLLTKAGKREKSPWYVRLAAQIISRHMGKQGIRSYQCVAMRNWNYEDNVVDVQVPTEFIISSVLCSVGDGVSAHGLKQKYFSGEAAFDPTARPSEAAADK